MATLIIYTALYLIGAYLCYKNAHAMGITQLLQQLKKDNYLFAKLALLLLLTLLICPLTSILQAIATVVSVIRKGIR